jgi:regulation of enolase protein 1 (concanavalin A-like superfamily)
MSISYGECETLNGASSNAAYNSVYQQAVAEGISVFVAAGDSGAAGCDNSAVEATHGIVANAFASTPYNVAVGGTDFSDTYSGTNSSYWNSNNTADFGSALSYIPETPWNDSCAGALLAQYLGYSTTYGAGSLCNDPIIGPLVETTVAGGGAPSRCATGTPSSSGVVSGSCQGWPKPAWQVVLGNPSDGVRDTPDVSLFAADGLWGHYYIFCWSDIANGGTACSGSPSNWSGAGGTSFATPIMAGIQALVNQATASRQGNPNPTYYQFAASEYGAGGNSSCNSSNGNTVSGSCIFYDVNLGDMDVDCTGADCYLGGGSLGVLSTSNSAFMSAYAATAGWDFATGIGSVNATNLVNSWPGARVVPTFVLSASPASMTLIQGTSGSGSITVTPQNGFSGSVTLSASGLPSGVTASYSPNPVTSGSTLTLTAGSSATTGTATLTITGVSGSLSHSTALSLTVKLVPTLPSVWSDGDIGAPAVAGSASYGNNVFTVTGAGTQIYGTADMFHFVYQPLSGDGTIVARVVSVQGASGYGSAGVMLRETLSAGSANAKTSYWPAYHAIYFDERSSTGSSTAEPGALAASLPYWLKVTRSGNVFTSYASLDGVNWTQLGTSQTITMASTIYAGLAVNSGSSSTAATATFDNVSLSSASAPAPMITGVSVTTGAVGNPVAITGTGFGATQGGSLVLLQGMPVTVNSWSTTSLNITIPSGATSGPLLVSVAPTMNDSNPVTFTVTSQPLPTPWLDQDVGSVGVIGQAGFGNGTFTVQGAGTQIYRTSDAFHFVYQPLSGDGTIVARVVSVQGASGYGSAGVMLRETLSAGSTNAKTSYWPAYHGIYFDERSSTGSSTAEPGALAASLPYWLKVTRSGNTFTGYVSSDGANWVQLGTSQTISMATNIYVGLAVNSGSSSTATATFDNASITKP